MMSDLLLKISRHTKKQVDLNHSEKYQSKLNTSNGDVEFTDTKRVILTIFQVFKKLRHGMLKEKKQIELLEMKTAICEKKNTLDGVDGRRHDGELEDMVIETFQNKT